MLRIKSPAIKTKKGKVVTGQPDHKTIIKEKHVKGQRGFVDSSGKFDDREKAAKIANKSGQTKHKLKHLHSEQLIKSKK